MATSSKRKKAVAATVAAAALLLGGTFAWTSISQQALNESAGIVNVGGRLHDDFDGENKDVYVENFTDPLDGGQPIYARVKLTEYMEVGQDAGGRDDVDGDGVYEAVPVIDGTSIDDPDSWEVHIPDPTTNDCTTEGTHRIHDHWTWTMGGDDTDNNPDGKTVFMPTFNKDKDSLKAEINGTYDGTNENDKIYYDDYVVYNTAGGLTVDMQDPDFTKPDGADEATPLTEAEGEVTTVEGIAYYDDDTDKEDNNGTRQEEETHTAKETQSGSVMLMADWDGTPGNFWVYDIDGWAYWANPIMPGEATGLLLDEIKMTKNPGEKCYYAINVVAQFATVGDWEYFYKADGSQEFDGTQAGWDLLNTVSQSVYTVTVERTQGSAVIYKDAETAVDRSVTFKAALSTGEAGNFDWKVYNTELDELEGYSFAAGEDGAVTLTIDPAETNANLIVAAWSEEHPGVVGLSSIAIAERSWQDVIAAMDPGTTATIEIDGIDWFLLAKEDNKALMIASEPLQKEYIAQNDPIFMDFYRADTAVSYQYAFLNSDAEAYTGLDPESDGRLTKELPSFKTYIPTLWEKLIPTGLWSTIYDSTEPYVNYEAKAWLPSISDFAAFSDYSIGEGNDTGKNCTHNSTSVITNEMLDLMIENGGALVCTRSTDMSSGSSGGRLAVAKPEGTYETHIVSQPKSLLNLYPMFWVDYTE